MKNGEEHDAPFSKLPKEAPADTRAQYNVIMTAIGKLEAGQRAIKNELIENRKHVANLFSAIQTRVIQIEQKKGRRAK